MAYFVDRVVICEAFEEPDQHYQLLSGGRSQLVSGRRPSMRFIGGASGARGGIGGIVGREATLFEDLSSSSEKNEVVNQLRDEVREWRTQRYPGTAIVTRRLLEWWFERNEERKALGRRFFFCQQEAIETVVYLYEVQNRRKMPETGNLLRYALKLATGTRKTVVMAMLVAWSTLHKRKVSGSTLSANFLVLVPNLTVRDRVSGFPRGDGLEPGGEHNLYNEFDVVPPEYLEEFQPNVMVKNWQSIPLEAKRDDWIGEEILEEGRFIPAAVLRAMRRRAQQDPNAVIQRMLKNWRDVFLINDEAHHAYGEKKSRKGEEPEFLRWSKILDRISKATRVSLVADLSATPWYGSGSAKPEGSLYEWLVSDFSVYDAFESGLVKVVRLPDPDQQGRIYLDLWDLVKGAKTKDEYLRACKGAIASIYASWSRDYQEWSQTFDFLRTTPCPVLLCVADNATRAAWLFEHLTKEYEFLRNPNDEDRKKWHTIQVDTGVFDANKGNEANLREIVSTVGRKGMAGENVRCVVSVQMLTEGWDVKSVSHILGIRAFGSPLLTEQIIGRGLRRTNYDVLNQPLAERPEGYEETVDAFGIPFVGFPVQKRKRPRTGSWEQARLGRAGRQKSQIPGASAKRPVMGGERHQALESGYPRPQTGDNARQSGRRSYSAPSSGRQPRSGHDTGRVSERVAAPPHCIPTRGRALRSDESGQRRRPGYRANVRRAVGCQLRVHSNAHYLPCERRSTRHRHLQLAFTGSRSPRECNSGCFRWRHDAGSHSFQSRMARLRAHKTVPMDGHPGRGQEGAHE